MKKLQLLTMAMLFAIAGTSFVEAKKDDVPSIELTNSTGYKIKVNGKFINDGETVNVILERTRTPGAPKGDYINGFLIPTGGAENRRLVEIVKPLSTKATYTLNADNIIVFKATA
jgi:hypothetical protein